MKNSLITAFVILTLLLTSCGNEKVGTDDENVNKAKTVKSQIKPLSKDVIIGLQLAGGRDKVLELDCNKYENEGRAYCESEKKELAAISQEVTWESVLKKGNQYISTFDCRTIKSDYGKKYCLEYQVLIAKK